jgi:hypothetical protein
MGSRTTNKLKEIEELRGSLEHKLGEIEHRFPIAGLGRKAAAMLAGTSAGGTAIAFAFRRFRKKRSKAKAPKGAPAVAQPVVVNVIPKSATLVAVAGIAVWAGVRLYEAMQKSKSDATDGSVRGSSGRPAVVRPMPEGSRQSGAGS